MLSFATKNSHFEEFVDYPKNEWIFEHILRIRFMDILKGLMDGISKNVLVLGFVSFLTDVSSEMIFPILPLFLSTILGVGTQVIGLIEGVADSMAGLSDIIFGYFSDKMERRKDFVLAGYGLSSVLKVGLIFANSWPMVFVVRGAERIGKSLRGAPRDAIIAASTNEKNRGKAFGLHRSMDTAGAIIGPAIAYLILNVLGNTEPGFRAVFAASIIPAFLAVLAIILFVKEPQGGKKPAEMRVKRPGFWTTLRTLSSKYRRFVIVSMLFSLAYFSFALLLVRADELGVEPENILLLYLLYNIVYLFASVPAGIVSDRLGRKNVIVASFIIYALICIGFSTFTSFWQLTALFALYGIFVAVDEGVNKAYISDMTDEKERATAFGAYSTAVSAAYLPANVVFGIIWAGFGAGFAFSVAGFVALIAGVALMVFVKD